MVVGINTQDFFFFWGGGGGGMSNMYSIQEKSFEGMVLTLVMGIIFK